jgi:hypothetical protein
MRKNLHEITDSTLDDHARSTRERLKPINRTES